MHLRMINFSIYHLLLGSRTKIKGDLHAFYDSHSPPGPFLYKINICQILCPKDLKMLYI